jgi:hypothetical protein
MRCVGRKTVEPMTFSNNFAWYCICYKHVYANVTYVPGHKIPRLL